MTTYAPKYAPVPQISGIGHVIIASKWRILSWKCYISNLHTFFSFIELFFVNVLLKQCIFCLQIITIRDNKSMLHYIHGKLQSYSRVIVTLIANILFSVSVCMNIPLIWQDYHKNKFSNGSAISFFLPKFKAGLSLSIPVLLDAPDNVDFVQVILFCWWFVIQVLFKIKKGNSKCKS